MPAIQRGQAYRLGPNRWGLRYYDAAGGRRRKSPFPSKSAALAHYRDVIEPELRGDARADARADARRAGRAVPRAPRRHGARAHDPHPARAAPPRRGRVRRRAAARPGAHERRDRRRGGRASPRASATPHGRRSGRRSAPPCAGATWPRTRPSWRAATASPRRAPVRAFTLEELDAIAAELAPAYRPLPAFAAATGLRPEEWAGARAPRHRPRSAASLTVRRTVSSGEVVELGKTTGSRRQVPLSPRALDGARRDPAAARHAAAVPGRAGRAAQPRQLAPPRVGARHRGVRGSRSPRGSTTCARRSPRTRSPPASRCSSWRGSWARASR